jgi:hypothetical protein
MASIKHSKYKNTGILFELCVRQITSDLMNNRDSKAIKIFKKYFTNTQLGDEYALYSSIVNSNKLNESKSEILLSTVLDQYRKLDTKKIDKLKYNLIKEIKASYDIDDFFKAKINNYRVYAAVYTVFEHEKSGRANNTEQVVDNKMVIMEHTMKSNAFEKREDAIVNELIKEDKDIRLLTYNILVKKFNEKYSDLSERQKYVLKEYIYNISDTVKLKAYLNEELTYVKKELEDLHKNSKEAVTKIKLKEVIKLINPIRDNENVKDEIITGILQCHQLINELK